MRRPKIVLTVLFAATALAGCEGSTKVVKAPDQSDIVVFTTRSAAVVKAPDQSEITVFTGQNAARMEVSSYVSYLADFQSGQLCREFRHFPGYHSATSSAVCRKIEEVTDSLSLDALKRMREAVDLADAKAVVSVEAPTAEANAVRARAAEQVLLYGKNWARGSQK